jgi:hypothetical protein
MKKKQVKLNLSLDDEFYQFLKKNAEHDFVKVATWTKQYLKRHLLQINKGLEELTKNDHGMGS